MQDSKLFQLFSKISGYEHAQLKRFLEAPYHNRREDVQKLYEFLCLQNRRKSPDYDKQKAWAYCYGTDEPYRDNDMRSLMTFLLQAIERFFMVETLLHKDPLQQHFYLAQLYQKMQLLPHAQRNLEQLEKHLLKTETLRNSKYLRARYEYDRTQHEFFFNLQNNQIQHLQALTNSFETQFVAEQLQIACGLLAHQTLQQVQYNTGLLDAVLEYVQNNKPQLLELPAIGLYYYYYKSSTEKGQSSEAYFAQYLQQLLPLKEEFTNDELSDLYKMAINYSIRQINLGNNSDQAYDKKLFLLYQSGLLKNIFVENGILSRFTFKNVVSLAIRLAELDWVDTFVQTYSPTLSAHYRLTYTAYALGKCCFARKDYPNTLSHLQQVEFGDIFLSLDMRVMQLKIYYELGEYILLDSLIQRFRMFLLRKKKSLGYHFEVYKNIVRFTARLMRLEVANNAQIQRLREKITTTAALTERGWLLAQLDKKKT